MEATWTLFLPKFDVVRQVLEEGTLGRVVAAHADMGERFDEPHRIMRPELAGGPLLDLGTYAVTFATWTLGAPDMVTAVATPAPNGGNGQLAIALGSLGGGSAALHTTSLADTATTASVIGTEGRIDLGTRLYSRGRRPCTSAAGRLPRGSNPWLGTTRSTSKLPKSRTGWRRVRPARR